MFACGRKDVRRELLDSELLAVGSAWSVNVKAVWAEFGIFLEQVSRIKRAMNACIRKSHVPQDGVQPPPLFCDPGWVV